jgi:amino acid transporter
MAIYPALFVQYLGQYNPQLTAGGWGYGWKVGVVALCCLWNLRGAPSVGNGSMGLFALLLTPFAVLVGRGLWIGMTLHPAVQWGRPASSAALSGAVLVALWNYMGWDNASTVAQEVEAPQRNYPRAMLGAIALVTITYVLPLAAVAMAGLGVENLRTGEWAAVAARMGGPWLGWAVVAGGALTGVGMFNALVMSYSRLPLAMAEDGMLPRVLALRNRRDVPWVSVLACGTGWALALQLPFDRLISIDLILYGSVLMLEFVALVALRLREPLLERPFRAGSLPVAVLLGVGPAGLIGYALWVARGETIAGNVNALLLAGCVALAGPVLYGMTEAVRRRARARDV